LHYVTVNMRHTIKAALLLALLAHCFAFQGHRGLWEPDEGRYTAVADEMLRLDDWITPRLHHEQPHWTKPPLTYWAIAVSIARLGRSEFAVRFPGALTYFLTILVIYQLGRTFLVRRPWLAVLVYASFLFPAAASNIITADNPLTLVEATAVLAFARSAWGDNKESQNTWNLIMWAAFGVAIFIKGPPGLLPLIPIGVYVRFGQTGTRAYRLRWLRGGLVMLAVSLPWFAFVTVKNPGLARYFLIDETFRRMATGYHHRHSEWYGPFIVYLPALIAGSLPWTFTIAQSIKRWILARFSKDTGWTSEQDGKKRFLILWVTLPILILSLASSRSPLYLLPFFVPLALLVATRLDKADRPAWNRRRVALLSGWFLLLLCARVSVAYFPTQRDSRTIARALSSIDRTSFDEIVFYDTKARRAVGFYLDKEVEEVRDAFLNDELDEREMRLWIVPYAKHIQFRTRMSEHQKTVRLVGAVDDRFLIYTSPNDAMYTHQTSAALHSSL
jgi:4-amino-4-deoxy-L-arabinose transferase-like glycosyltransferase